MACNCGGNCDKVARRPAPRGYPAIVPGGLYELTPGGACPSWATKLADDKGLRLAVFVCGGSAWHLVGAYCQSGNSDANMKRAFQDAADYHNVVGVVLSAIGLIPSPLTPALLVLGPLNLAVAQLMSTLAQGKSPSASDVAGLAAAGAPALAAVGGDPTGGKAAELGGTFAGLAELAADSGLAPQLFPPTVPANSATARDAKKNALKRFKKRAAAKASSKTKADACRSRGGVFDPRAPDGCRIVGPPSKAPAGKGGGKALVGAGIALAIAKALL